MHFRAEEPKTQAHCAQGYTVERTPRGWFYARTSRFGDINGMKGPYSSERSVALMIAREQIRIPIASKGRQCLTRAS